MDSEDEDFLKSCNTKVSFVLFRREARLVLIWGGGPAEVFEV